MLNISEIVKKTEEMFDLFNQHFYSNELTRPAITISPDGGRGAYGWCSIHEMPTADFTGKSTYVPSTLTAPLRSWPPRSSMK